MSSPRRAWLPVAGLFPAVTGTLLAAALLVTPARAEEPAEEHDPPTPTELAVRVALPAVGVVAPFNAGRLATPGGMLAWPLQYALDDLMLPRVRAVFEPQLLYPSPETFPVRLRLGIRWVPLLRGLQDESSRFFLGAGVNLSSRVAASGELGYRIPVRWPLWTFFVALRTDYRFTGDARYETSLLTGFTIF